MNEDILQDIMQNYDNSAWKAITGPRYPYSDEGFQLFLFDNDVEHGGKTYRCVIVQKVVYDGNTMSVDRAENIFCEIWEL